MLISQVYRRLPSTLLLTCLVTMFQTEAVLAQSKTGETSPTAFPIEQPATTSALPDSSTNPEPSPFVRLDALSLKGWDIPYPKVGDTILSNHWGIRDALADVGIGISPINTLRYQDNFLQNDNKYHGRQLYNGQDVTRTNGSLTLTVTYDLGMIGIHGGQLATSLDLVNSTLPTVNGPNKFLIGRLQYFQQLFDDRLEFTIGYIDNTQEYLGTTVGGNLAASSLGPQATIPFQLGLSYGGFAVPAINVRYRFTKQFYNKIGVQRSLPPGGATAENRLDPGGFRFHVPGTGVLVIDELGFNQASSKTTKSAWVRGGGIYNSTLYTAFDNAKVDNWAAFLAADRQLTQPDAAKPYRGIYVGATFNYAPPRQNFYTQYYEGRLYGIGLLRNRPSDLASLVTTYNVYSPAGLRARTPHNEGYYSGTWSAIASYAYRVRAGIYVQPGLGITVHPIYAPRFAPALNGYIGFITLF